VTTVFAVLMSVLLGYINRSCLLFPIDLVVVSSQEKSALLTEVAAEYVRTAPRVDRRCVKISIERLASGVAEQRLAEGWDTRLHGRRPHVWSPAARTWVALLRQHRAGKEEILPPTSTSLTQSPLVFAMPQRMAETLREFGIELGWREILELGTNPLGWSKFGEDKVAWGAFRIGETDPGQSTSGLHAVITSFDAAAGGTPDADDLRRTDVCRFVKSLASINTRYAETAGELLSRLYEADQRGEIEALRYVSAIPIEEKQAYEYNTGNPRSQTPHPGTPEPKVKLQAVSPKETLSADHPYVILEWIDTAHREAAEAFLRHLRTSSVQTRFLKAGFRNEFGQADPATLKRPWFQPTLQSRTLSVDPSVLEEMLELHRDVRSPGHNCPSGN
jgi:Ca-activated chloride channel family protein